jgi:hypothetical protein
MIVDNKDNVQWQIKIFNDTKFPFLIIDDWFSKNEEIAVWKELDYYYCNNSFYKRAENESDIAKIINNRNKIILHNPNTNLKAEDRWLESAENKLEVYEEFQKNYGNDKSKIESQIKRSLSSKSYFR